MRVAENLSGLVRQCRDLSAARRVHNQVLVACGGSMDRYLGNLLLQKYGKLGSVTESRRVFDSILLKNSISWNLMIAAYADNGKTRDARRLFERMSHRCVMSWTSIVSGYAAAGDAERAREVLERMPQHDVVAWNALLAAFARNGHLQEVRRSFARMPMRDVVSWTVAIGAYVLQKQGRDGLKLFSLMCLDGTRPNEVTFFHVLDACTCPANLQEGRQVLRRIQESGYLSDCNVVNSVITMLGKCGSCGEARTFFEGLPEVTVVTWNCIIAGYAQNELGHTALELFRLMCLSGEQPDRITFLHLLSGCVHAGLLEDGVQAFLAMREDFGGELQASLDHYACMIGLFALSGHLDDAEELLHSMPYVPNAISWRCFAAACKLHRDEQRAASSLKKAMEADKRNSGPYTLLFSVCKD